jgi:arsenite/tail-anchored protein-transporting ATPase
MQIQDFLKTHPNLKYCFTGGKGGVGKSVLAAAMGYHFAENGEKTLLASLNPVHSLSNLFGQHLGGGESKPVEGISNLFVIEVEINDMVLSYREKIANRLRDFLKWAEIPLNPEPFIDIATTNPAFQESAMFDKTMEIITQQKETYDRVIFDTAAVANAVRLIGLSKIYGLWLSRMLASRKEALSLRYQLSTRKEKVLNEIKRDPLMADLLAMNERFEAARKVLTNPNETAFFFVTIPQSLPISVVKRFITMVRGFNIPIGGVFVNGIIPEATFDLDGSGFLDGKRDEQARYLKIIRDDLGDLVSAHVRLQSREISGLNSLKQVESDMFESATA